MLRIHDILVRVRIRGSIPMTNGYGSCYFHQWPSRSQQKIIFFSTFSCLLLFEGTFTSFFKDKKSQRSHKIAEINMFFVLFLLDDIRIRIRSKIHISMTNGSGSGRPKTYGSYGSGSATLNSGLTKFESWSRVFSKNIYIYMDLDTGSVVLCYDYKLDGEKNSWSKNYVFLKQEPHMSRPPKPKKPKREHPAIQNIKCSLFPLKGHFGIKRNVRPFESGGHA